MKSKHNWILEGLVFGVIMFLFAMILDYFAEGFTFKGIWIKILIWLIGGLAYGFIMKLIRAKQKRDNT